MDKYIDFLYFHLFLFKLVTLIARAVSLAASVTFSNTPSISYHVFSSTTSKSMLEVLFDFVISIT